MYRIFINKQTKETLLYILIFRVVVFSEQSINVRRIVSATKTIFDDQNASLNVQQYVRVGDVEANQLWGDVVPRRVLDIDVLYRVDIFKLENFIGGHELIERVLIVRIERTQLVQTRAHYERH